MSARTDGPTVTVEVHADYACAWSRLGVHRFHQAVARLGDAAGRIELVHRAYRLAPDFPDEPRLSVEALAEMFGGRAQVDAMFAEMTAMGAAEGVAYRFDRVLEVNTLAAHRLVWLARQESPAVAAGLAVALFDAHFHDGVNIADHEELVTLAEKAGLPADRVRTFLASAEGTAEVLAEDAEARAKGVTAVPTFVLPSGEPLRGVTSTDEIHTALVRALAD
ncbi:MULTISPECIES: DsbA family oxidoreductase [Streptomyces]|uniref:2-hydroxychromene-2-carboxylate isomerase or DsbA-thioredoxin domain n=1 Tax=Streptomyces venezuelae (strain ATCC 10712 / CBS 650.69 / DSM 40230 / JCM 4526 / NBRC 13096 / PD 04745) TaxID=953739 RepID=F2RC39_STRVP|nr:DsbA family oxidoreductase [Streptomyces venezuelae]APE24790.1 hypothetical protein vnz_29665 [Streptomyces venezuelae]QES02138.1 DsbA family oxidoreductase [Streptomyces venezuelae ATCC 10712]CCA59290.1 2-hydroxychromene-2-carboxylate isomerase or DsbA-thioredoxin domain [Streptomyces venezuelae ATCC 10712]